MLAFYSIPVKLELVPISLKEARQQDTVTGEPAAEEVYIGGEQGAFSLEGEELLHCSVSNSVQGWKGRNVIGNLSRRNICFKLARALGETLSQSKTKEKNFLCLNFKNFLAVSNFIILYFSYLQKALKSSKIPESS